MNLTSPLIAKSSTELKQEFESLQRELITSGEWGQDTPLAGEVRAKFQEYADAIATERGEDTIVLGYEGKAKKD